MAKDPAFVHFSDLYREGRYAEALDALDRLFTRFPDAPELRWHRANCLEQLERFAEIKPELDLLLARKPDYVPAIVKRVKYAQIDTDAADDDDALSDAERERRDIEERARQHRISLEDEAELRRALALDANMRKMGTDLFFVDFLLPRRGRARTWALPTAATNRCTANGRGRPAIRSPAIVLIAFSQLRTGR